ncbi:MAG: LON peptidase substrate-binding domain-containing protein, partial [Desulfobacterales bacterium]
MAESDRDDLISIIEESEDFKDLPDVLPLLPVRDVVIFTDMLLPLFIGREKSVRAVEEAMAQDRFLFLATQKQPGLENPKAEEIYRVGTVGRILRMLKLPDGRMKALVQGLGRARIIRYVRKKSYYRVKIELLEEEPTKAADLEIEALMRNVRESSEKILALRGELTNDVGTILESIEDPGRLADLVASNLKLKIEESQALLEMVDSQERLKKVNELLSREVDLSSMQAKIQSDVRDEISKSQRDYFLREQVRAIHRELGDLDDKTQEVDEYRKKCKKAR